MGEVFSHPFLSSASRTELTSNVPKLQFKRLLWPKFQKVHCGK